MAKSSINFQKAFTGGLHHNDRTTETEPDYLLPPEHRLENEVDFSANEAGEKIKKLYQEAKQNFHQKFGQKLQVKTYLWEAVLNINKNHTLEDVRKAVLEIEKETGFTSVQIAVHRDEGHINERGIAIHNLHAHVTFFTLDRQTGEQLYRKKLTERQEKEGRLKPMNRNRLSKLQDIVAKSLEMQRGKRGSGRKRLGHGQYREVEKQKAEQLAKLKDLQAENKKLRQQLQEAGAGRPEYAQLEAKKRELEEQIRAKNMTIEKLHEEIKQLHDRLIDANYSIEALEKQNKQLSTPEPTPTPPKPEKDAQIAKLEQENADLRAENKELKTKVSYLSSLIDSMKNQIIDLKNKLLKPKKPESKPEPVQEKKKATKDEIIDQLRDYYRFNPPKIYEGFRKNGIHVDDALQQKTENWISKTIMMQYSLFRQLMKDRGFLSENPGQNLGMKRTKKKGFSP